MKVIDDGHIYELNNLGPGTQTLKFVKRSGGAIQYEEEWPGVQVQEVVRALIHRTKYLNDIIPCLETRDSIWHLRMVLFLYEARAYRRKQEALNRKGPKHDDSERMRLWRQNPFADVPFDENLIEYRAVGEDGHVLMYLEGVGR